MGFVGRGEACEKIMAFKGESSQKKIREKGGGHVKYFSEILKGHNV